MGLTVADLSAKLGLDTSVFDRGISGVLGKMSPIGGAATSNGLIAGAAIAGIGVAAVKLGEEFDAAYDSIRIGTGATDAKLGGLKDSFKQVVQDVPASFGDASAAITGLNQRMGITGPRLRELSDQFLELSHITGTDVAEDVRLGTRLFGDWSIETGQQADALDQLFRATQQSGIGLSDLMSTVVQFGAPLRNMGFSFSESIGMLSKWEKEGVNITTVLSGMRFALKRFAAEGVDPAQGLAKAIDDIAKAKTRAAAMKIGSDIFGLRGASDTVAAIREGRFQYQEFVDTILNGRDTIHTAAKDTEDMGEAWTKFVNTAKVNVEPGLTTLFNGISKLLDLGQVNVNPWFHEAVSDLDLLRDLVSKPMAVGHIVGDIPSGLDPAILRTREKLATLRQELQKKNKLGDTDTASTTTAIRRVEKRLATLRANVERPARTGHLNTSSWTGAINLSMQKLLEFRDLAAAGITPGSMSQHKSGTKPNIAPAPAWHPPGRAAGGYAPARDGGTAYTLGEGGEGEYIIPESKMGRGPVVNINVANVNGTDRAAAQKLADTAGAIFMQQVRWA